MLKPDLKNGELQYLTLSSNRIVRLAKPKSKRAIIQPKFCRMMISKFELGLHFTMLYPSANF